MCRRIVTRYLSHIVNVAHFPEEDCLVCEELAGHLDWHVTEEHTDDGP
jgi:hypothetical protein